MKRKRKDGYTKEEIEYVKEIAPNRTNKEITKMFNEKFNKNKTENAIIQLKWRYKIYSYTKIYNKEQLKYLNKIKEGKSRREITKLFNEKFNQNRTEASVKSVMQENGMKLSDDGRFKKGIIPANTMPVGTELVRGDGYIYIKIKEPNVWKQKHHIIWEETKGPIPDNHVILFGDGDKTNMDIDNLILISRAQLLMLNQCNLIQDDADLTKIGINICDIHLKIGEIRRDKAR